MAKISIPWTAIKGTWNSCFLKKIKKFAEDEIMKLLGKWQKVVEQNVEHTVYESS